MEFELTDIYVSVVVPVYRGANYLPRLVEAIAAERARWSEVSGKIAIGEAIFALDSPVDDSQEVIQALAAEHAWIRVVELSRNYGQHSATVAGILHASGDWVVTMDEDLQHDPRDIPRLLAAAVEGQADVVYAQPMGQVHGGGYRDRFSRGIKAFIAWLAGNPAVRRFNSFRLIRGDIARAASSICAQHTYFDVALSWYTNRIVSAPLEISDQRYQSEQQSGYSFWRLVQHGRRLILTSDFRILRFTVSLAGLSVLLAALYGAWIFYRRFFSESGYDVAGWPSLALMILVFGAVSVFLLGLLVAFTQVIMLQLQGKPAFFVVDREKDETLRFEFVKLLNHADPGD